MASLNTVRDWMAEHGYRDKVPRRDALNPASLFYTFVKDGRPNVGVQSVGGQVEPEYFEQMKQMVIHNEQGDRPNGR